MSLQFGREEGRPHIEEALGAARAGNWEAPGEDSGLGGGAPRPFHLGGNRAVSTGLGGQEGARERRPRGAKACVRCLSGPRLAWGDGAQRSGLPGVEAGVGGWPRGWWGGVLELSTSHFLPGNREPPPKGKQPRQTCDGAGGSGVGGYKSSSRPPSRLEPLPQAARDLLGSDRLIKC